MNCLYFQYSERGLVAEYDGAGQMVRSYGWLPAGASASGPAYIRTPAAVHFSHGDVAGSSQRLTDAAGTVVWSGRSDAFGNTRVDPASTASNPLRLPGQYFDAETGLHYNVARYYEPESGRYLAEDPLNLEAGPNLYTYALSNPIRNIDPLGLAPKSTCVFVPHNFDASGCYLVDIIENRRFMEYPKLIRFRVLILPGAYPWVRDMPDPKVAGPAPFPAPGPPGSPPGSGVTIGPGAGQIATIYIDWTGRRFGLFADYMADVPSGLPGQDLDLQVLEQPDMQCVRHRKAA